MAETPEDDPFTTIRIRRYDHERLSSLAQPTETHWEVIRRLVDAYMLGRK